MATLLRWFALLAFFLAILASTPVGARYPRFAQLNWVAVGLFLWLWSIIINASDVDVDVG